MKRDELAAGGFLFIFGAVTTVLSIRLGLGSPGKAESGFFPFIMGVLLLFLSAAYIVRLLLPKKAGGDQPVPKAARTTGHGGKNKSATHPPPLGIPEPTWRMLLCLGAMILAAFFFDRLGYLLTVFFIMAVCLWTLGSKKWWVTLGTAAVTAVASYTVFSKLLHVILPRGFLSF